MKPYLIATFLLFTGITFAQDVSKISVTGNAQKTFYPVTYKITFLLQEEVTSDNSKLITKTALDSITRAFFANIKAYGLREADVSLIKTSSTTYGGYSGRSGTNLYCAFYQVKDQKPGAAKKIVDDLRFIGLKGVVARPQYAILSKTILDSLNTAAMADARTSAEKLAKQCNRSVGEVITFNGGYNTIRDLNTEYDNQDTYNLTRFEISLVDNKTYPITVNITYELKK